MALPRRSFLKAFGALPLAPAAAKEAMAQAGINASAIPMSAMKAQSAYGLAQGSIGPGETYAASTDWLIANGVPNWMRDQITMELGPPDRLDPDLAANRSFSLSAKMRIQRERNIEARCASVVQRRLLGKVWDAWMQATGMELW